MKKLKKNNNRRIELNSKELKVNLEKLQEDVKRAYGRARRL